jgi:hypothetical protein
MSDIETRFHETWIGMVQPIDGLVVSLPVLVEAQCMHRHAPSFQQTLLDACPPVEAPKSAAPKEAVSGPRRTAALPASVTVVPDGGLSASPGAD